MDHVLSNKDRSVTRRTSPECLTLETFYSCLPWEWKFAVANPICYRGTGVLVNTQAYHFSVPGILVLFCPFDNIHIQ
jgi:hypothetical protein